MNDGQQPTSAVIHDIQENEESPIPNPNLEPNYYNHGQEIHDKHQKSSVIEISDELDCIFLNEMPTALHYDKKSLQLFVGTEVGNIHRFKIIHNSKIKAIGILPNPNIFENVCNVHTLTKEPMINEECKANATHARLFEQRQSLIHKKRKDIIYNRAILDILEYNGLLFVTDACSNIHCFQISSNAGTISIFKHVHQLSMEHYFIDILQNEYKTIVDELFHKQRKYLMNESNDNTVAHDSFNDEWQVGKQLSLEMNDFLSLPMKCGTNSVYEMFFDQLVFNNAMKSSVDKTKLGQDFIITDLKIIHGQIFINTNLPFFTVLLYFIFDVCF